VPSLLPLIEQLEGKSMRLKKKKKKKKKKTKMNPLLHCVEECREPSFMWVLCDNVACWDPLTRRSFQNRDALHVSIG